MISIIFFYIVVIIIPLIIAVTLVYLLIKFSQMNQEKVVKAFNRAKKLYEDEKYADAESVLYKAFKAVGWDYAGLLQLKKVNKLSTIKQTEDGLTKLARTVRVLPKNNFAWVAEPMYFLGDIYRAQNKANKRSRLFADMRNFIDDYGPGLSRIARADLLSRLFAEEASMEMEDGNYRSALRLDATSFLYKVEKYYSQGALKELQDLIPYRGTDVMNKSLKELGREDDRDELVRIIQRGIVDNGARIELRRVNRDLDDFFTGRRTTSDTQGEIARMMLKKVLEKADSDKDKEETGGDSGIGGNGIIRL